MYVFRSRVLPLKPTVHPTNFFCQTTVQLCGMQNFIKLLKRFGIDAAGYGLIILGLLTGWLPGPGGIPLILAGLGLLSIHNHWARKILIYFKENGDKFMKYLFPENPWIKALHDFFAVSLLISAVVLISAKVNAFTIGISIALIVLAIVDFMYNRKRWLRLTGKIK
jgi:hypothetical protein